MSEPPPCADPELSREWPDDDDERCPFCNAKHGEPCRLEEYDGGAAPNYPAESMKRDWVAASGKLE